MKRNTLVKLTSLDADAVAVRRKTISAANGGGVPLESREAVRVSPNGYFAALFLGSFAAGFLAYLQQVELCFWLLGATWLVVPPLWWFDRVSFDGESLRRTGLVPRLWGVARHQPQQLKLADIERIETAVVRVLRSGGQVFYRYRSEISGGAISFAFASGGAPFRRMVRRLFPLVAADKLDARSLELRDYLIEPAELREKLKTWQIPSSEVLSDAIEQILTKTKSRPTRPKSLTTSRDSALNQNDRETVETRAAQLHRFANELRVSGNLRQSLEAFRRALIVAAPDSASGAWLLFEFARGLHSYAGIHRNAALERRSFAVLRLAAMRNAAHRDAALLARIGESWFQYVETARANRAFQRAAEFDADNFRARLGLAEIALNDGKLAHVVHHFQAAARAADDEALRAWARAEADYFACLNTDDGYIEAEVTRINRLHAAQTNSRICLRLALCGLLATLCGVFFDDAVAQIGLALAAATALLWLILIVAGNFLTTRNSTEIKD